MTADRRGDGDDGKGKGGNAFRRGGGGHCEGQTAKPGHQDGGDGAKGKGNVGGNHSGLGQGWKAHSLSLPLCALSKDWNEFCRTQ